MAIESKLKKERLFLRFTLARLKNYFIRMKTSLYAAIILCAFIMMTVLYLGGYDLAKQSLEVSVTLSGIVFIFLFLVIRDDNPVDIVKSGAEGEHIVLEELKKLDNNFVLMNSVILPDEKSSIGTREIDFIAISRKCVYIVEVKNNRGHIEVENMADRWKVEKTSQYNNVYEKTIKNPIRQTFAQKKVLQTFLYNERVYIKGIPFVTVVVFANEDAKLSDIFIADDANQAVVQLEHLIPFIENKDGYLEEMSSKSRKKMIKFLEKK